MKNNITSRLIGLLIVGSVSLNFNLKVFISIVNPVSDAAAEGAQGDEAKLVSSLPRPSTTQSEETPQAATTAPSRPITMAAALSEVTSECRGFEWLANSAQLVTTEKRASGDTEVFSLDIHSNGKRRIGAGRFPSVSPDQQWLITLNGRRWELRNLSDQSSRLLGSEMPFEPTVFMPPQWSRDGRFVAVIETMRAPPEAHSPPAHGTGVRVVDVGKAATKSASREFGTPRITIYNVRNAEKTTFVPVDDEFAYYAQWGAKHELYFVGMRSFRSGRLPYTALYRFDLDSDRVERVYHLSGGFMQGAAPRVSPDGRQIALVLDVDGKKWDDYDSLVLIDAETGILRRLTTSVFVRGNTHRWAPNGKRLYALTRNGGLDQVSMIDLEGNVTAVTRSEVAHADLEVSPDGRWLSYRTSDGYGRTDIRIRATNEHTERVIAVSADPSRRYKLGSFRQIKWRSSDGLELYAYLVLPPEFSTTKRYPLFVEVHGGGIGSPLDLSGALSSGLAPTPLEWHAWASLGYVVLVPDMRSSGEYGPSVAAARYRSRNWDMATLEWDAMDIEAATRSIVATGYIDSRRIAIFGHSAGGARVNLLLTRSNLFGAGIIHEAVFSGTLPFMIHSLSGENTGKGFDESYISNGKRFAEDPSLFTESFLFDGYKSRTPTLIIVGDPMKGAADSMSSEILFSMLQQYHVASRMIRYPDEGHNATNVGSAMHRFDEMVGWLNIHIPDQALE